MGSPHTSFLRQQLAEAVEELLTRPRLRNDGIDNAMNAVHCCAMWRCHESILRAGGLKIVLQHPQPEADTIKNILGFCLRLIIALKIKPKKMILEYLELLGKFREDALLFNSVILRILTC